MVILYASFVSAGLDDKPSDAAWGIQRTKHNLSTSGATVGNTIYAVDTGDPRATQVCIFCHTPHGAESAQASEWAPLWNHQNTSATFLMASSANVVHSGPNKRSWADGAPTGISKKCLSCHDGTVAIGAVLNGTPILVTGAKGGSGDTLTGSRNAGGGLGPDGYGQMDAGFIGTDLRGGHVISFNYKGFWDGTQSDESNYKSWNNITPADRSSMFDRQGRMQCHSCHDPHTDWCDENPGNPGAVGNDPLWRKQCVSTTNDVVCKVCHTNFTVFKTYSF